ncbi:hypothetical protein [Aphanothece sacrum]|uniref:Uncharacterized protein n=1 Tax=Aphanothece sacrum FPU1 TaxID=1920663 RepID=A0A401IEX4_APHSA|nr:hypothetical protein [Aphanothece sacrum]GBF79823.1 hypothetical protein AsFPU1_1223 [Aphanothece sacrum FPU1]GBF84835.1 hypothetical protein AsFPU3_1890 [Aphanothece sacrum FPU3]
MSEPTTVTYSIAEVLKRIEDKLDRMDEKFEAKLDRMDEKFKEKLDRMDEKFEAKLDTLQKEVIQKIDKQSEEITTIKATLQAQQPLIQKIPDLAEKVGELKNWRQIVIIAITALISGSITWVIRGGTFKP